MTDEPDWIALSGYHPSYARVYHAVVQPPHALGLIDTNGDGREIALVVRAGRGGRRDLAGECDDVSEQSEGWSDDFVWAYGRAPAGSTVVISYRDDLHEVVADDRGWWVFFHPAGPQADGTLTPPQRFD